MFELIYERLKNIIRLDRAISFVWQAGKGWTIASLCLVFFQGILPLLALYLVKLIVDAVSFSISAPDKATAFKNVAVLIGFAVAIAILNSLIQLILNLVKEIQSITVTDHVSTIIHSKSIEVDLEYYEDSKFYDTLHRAQAEGDFRPTKIVNDLITLFLNGISFVVIAALLFSFHYLVAIVLILSVMPGILVRMSYSKILYNWMRERTKTERKSGYYNWILTGDQHAKEVRLFGFGDYFIKQYNGLRKTLKGEHLVIMRRQLTVEFAAQAGATIAVFCAFGMVVYQTIHGKISLGDMVMYFQAFQRGLAYLKEFLVAITELYADNLFITCFYEFLDFEPRVKESLNPRPVPKPIEQGIQFENVCFKYPSSERKILEDISFSIKPNEVVALIGENGSGKTTLVKLLCRLYDPDTGSVTIDHSCIKDYNSKKLRMEMGVIFQDFAQYHMTVKENIWIGNAQFPPDLEKIKHAAYHAGVHELIESLPDGYNTYLGKWFEQGEELSVGQWQRIALARAFMRNSQIIILDEPSSSLDVNSEFEIFSKFRELCKGRTVLLVSHRFSTVRMADRILVLESGKIIENGSHEELYQSNGKYSKMFNKQAQYYK